ncbi:carbohydrate kinase [Arthrobacter sp. B1805]|uniref:carbohydrate kinase family protein n=1 Tax=Arthrobacter sp. B1805 TaxID=2058892 RepID=UPI002158A10F|nr:carbohydrate kinase [Arthrobacter sp. B1805]
MEPIPAPGMVVIGESLVDVVHDDARRATVEHPGGSPMNVAVGTARLGLPTTLVTAFGDDHHGQAIEQHLLSNGVDVVKAGGTRTSTAGARIGTDGAATYSFDISWDIATSVDTARSMAAAHFHTGSIATVLEPGCHDVLDLLEQVRNTSTISFDPNCRPTITPDRDEARRTVERFVALTDIVKASDEDLAWLYPGTELKDVMDAWLALGAALVVITCGGQGSLAATASVQASEEAAPVDVVDTVGAGDSFMAALLAGLRWCGVLGADDRARIAALDHVTLQQLLSFAATAAAITCSRAGANPPSLSEVAAFEGVPWKRLA